MYKLEPIRFSINGRSYCLKFNWMNYMHITGRTECGKSLFFQDYKAYLQKNNRDDEVLFINYTNPQDAKIILDKDRIHNYKMVVIDNADIILDYELQNVIAENCDIYWVVIGYKMTFIPFGCMGVLRKRGKTITIDYSQKW